MSYNEDQKNIPSEYRPVCMIDDMPCANCYSYGAPCLNCDADGLNVATIINWKEFQHIVWHKYSTTTYEEFIEIEDQLRKKRPELFKQTTIILDL